VGRASSVFVWALLPVLLVAEESGPARLISGPVSFAIPSLRGQCLAALDVIVGPDGSVKHVRSLYGSLPLTDPLEEAVAGWAFRPALVEGRPQASHVLVAALFRPTVLRDAGPCGPPDRAWPTPPPPLPVPVVLRAAVYPRGARGGAVVTVEAEIASSGDVRSARAMGETTDFHGAAERAARAWRFRPGRHEGRPVATRAYLVFGFQAAR
jgi:hypothetical protein